MAVTETTDTTSVSGKIIKKFTTDLASSTSQQQDMTTWTCPDDVTSVRYLVVGGGGAGGAGFGGGGGGIRDSSGGYGSGGSGVVILQYDAPTILVRTRHFNVSGSGNLLVMEIQT